MHVPRTPPVAVTAGAGLRADAANGPVGNIRVPNTSAGVEGATAVRPSRAPERQSATGGAHGAAAGGQAAPPDDLAEGPAPFYRRLHLSPPRHVARVHLALPRRRRRLRLPPLGGSDGPRGLAAAAALPRARLYGQAARWVRCASCAPLVRRPSRRRCRGRCRNGRVAHGARVPAARRRAPAPAAGRSRRRAPPLTHRKSDNDVTTNFKYILKTLVGDEKSRQNGDVRHSPEHEEVPKKAVISSRA